MPKVCRGGYSAYGPVDERRQHAWYSCVPSSAPYIVGQRMVASQRCQCAEKDRHDEDGVESRKCCRLVSLPSCLSCPVLRHDTFIRPLKHTGIFLPCQCNILDSGSVVLPYEILFLFQSFGLLLSTQMCAEPMGSKHCYSDDRATCSKDLNLIWSSVS